LTQLRWRGRNRAMSSCKPLGATRATRTCYQYAHSCIPACRHPLLRAVWAAHLRPKHIRCPNLHQHRPQESSHPRAHRLRAETAVTLNWIARELRMTRMGARNESIAGGTVPVMRFLAGGYFRYSKAGCNFGKKGVVGFRLKIEPRADGKRVSGSNFV